MLHVVERRVELEGIVLDPVGLTSIVGQDGADRDAALSRERQRIVVQ
jgi:hypothetical protein